MLTRAGPVHPQTEETTMYDFQSAMADGKARAHRERQRGCSSSVRVFATAEERFEGMTEDDWQSWQDELADAVDAASASEGMDETEEETSIPPAKHAIPKPPAPAMASRTKDMLARERKVKKLNAALEKVEKVEAELERSETMNALQYVNKLAHLGLTLETAHHALGISRSMSYRYAAGSHPIPTTVAKLLRALAELGRAEV